MLARVLTQLGEEVPQRLRTTRFRNLIDALGDLGIEACLADDESATVLTSAAESPASTRSSDSVESRQRLPCASRHPRASRPARASPSTTHP